MIIIDNKILNEIANEVQDLNPQDFLTWYASINNNFELDLNPFSRSEQLKKYFIVNKKVVTLKSFPKFEIKTEEELKSFLFKKHGVYTNPLIKILKDYFNINYWDKILDYCISFGSSVESSQYSSLLSYSVNNLDFVDDNIVNLKKLIDNIINKVEEKKLKYYSDILEFLSFTITEKDKFENDWIIKSINILVKDSFDNPTKQFKFILDKTIRQFPDLDFENKKISKEFKKILLGNLPIKRTPDICYPYYFEINIQKFTQKQKVVPQIALNNAIVVLGLINEYLKEEYGVISHNVKVEKHIVALSVIHDDENLSKKLDYLIDIMIKKIEENEVVEQKEFEKYVLYLNLNDNLSSSGSGGKKTKI